jgi:hypothetical protein
MKPLQNRPSAVAASRQSAANLWNWKRVRLFAESRYAPFAEVSKCYEAEFTLTIKDKSQSNNQFTNILN